MSDDGITDGVATSVSAADALHGAPGTPGTFVDVNRLLPLSNLLGSVALVDQSGNPVTSLGSGGGGSSDTESIWTDDNGLFYIRINTAGTITWTFPNGTPTTAPGASGRPAGGSSIIMDKSAYQATAAATGYSIGDFINHYVTADPATGAVIATFWINVTTNALLVSSPSSANISPVSTVVTGAATSAKQDTGNTSVASIDSKTPALVAGAVPVSLPAATIIALTPPAAITGFATSAAQTTAQALLTQLHTDMIAATPAGTNIIGKVGIDQTTDGTTNAVRILTETTKIIGNVGIKDGTSTLTLMAASSGAPAATVVAVPVTIRDVNPNGPAVSASSAPVVIASDQATLAVAPDTSQVANGVSGTMLTPTKVKISVAAATTTTLVALVAAKKIRVLAMYLVSTGANTVNLQSHTTTTNSDGLPGYAANGGIVLPFNPIGWFDTTAGEALNMVTSGAGQVSGQLTYVVV